MSQSFIDFLKHRLQKPLPGIDAQLRMAPEPLADGPIREMNPPPHASASSILILLFPNDNEELELVLTLRSKDIDHGGQISFPGGRSDEGESPVDTALREAYEEIGVPREAVAIIGTLSDLYVSRSNNYVTPVVGYMDSFPELKLNPAEVEEAFTIELDSLVTKKNLTIENWKLMEQTYRVPFWDVHRVPLWGATAMIISEFLELYREFLATDDAD